MCRRSETATRHTSLHRPLVLENSVISVLSPFAGNQCAHRRFAESLEASLDNQIPHPRHVPITQNYAQRCLSIRYSSCTDCLDRRLCMHCSCDDNPDLEIMTRSGIVPCFCSLRLGQSAAAAN